MKRHLFPRRSVRSRTTVAGLAAVALAAVALVAAGPATAASVTLPTANGGFSYQLGGSYTPEPGATNVSRDRTVAPAGAGYYNICYVNLLQTQPDVPGQSTSNPPYGTTQWWKNNYNHLLLKNSSGQVIVDPDWNEALFDVRTATKRSQLLAIQDDWFQDCANDGYQAIEPDNLDAFLRSSGLITFNHTKEYLKLVIPYVHNIGLAIAQKNTADSPNGYAGIGKTFVNTVSPAQGFDFAIAEECAAYSECSTYTADYGNLVLQVEYTDNNPVQTRNGVSKTAYQWSCQDDGSQRSIILRDRDLRPGGTPGYVHQGC